MQTVVAEEAFCHETDDDPFSFQLPEHVAAMSLAGSGKAIDRRDDQEVEMNAAALERNDLVNVRARAWNAARYAGQIDFLDDGNLVVNERLFNADVLVIDTRCNLRVGTSQQLEDDGDLLVDQFWISHGFPLLWQSFRASQMRTPGASKSMSKRCR